MFSYYGSKSKIVDYYPPPKHKMIIEPFAGSARYSLKYWQNDVLLVDKYPVIVSIWEYLINATKADILNLPDIVTGQNVDDFDITQVEKWLIGFCINGGSASPKKTAKDYNRLLRDFPINQLLSANNLEQIRKSIDLIFN